MAFLVHLAYTSMIRKIYNASENILALEMSHENSLIMFLNVHMPQGDDAVQFDKLRDFTMLHNASDIIMLGDFNAHLGMHDLTGRDKVFIGPMLYHDHCNDNGEELKHLLHLGHFSVKNTWSKSPSLLTTWTNKPVSSQIDHLLCNAPLIRFRRIYAIWVHTVPTDHAFLSAEIQLPKPPSEQMKRKSDVTPPPSKRMKNEQGMRWDVGKLQDIKCVEEYRSALTIGSTALIELTVNGDDLVVNEPIGLWTRV